jgi:transposase
VKRGKTDAADAEAICEAVTRPTMRFVPVKTAARQAALLDHKARDFLVRQRTQTVNAIRAHLSEFGIVVVKGIHNLDRLLEAARDVPEAARPALELLTGQLSDLEERIEEATARITAAQKAHPLARRLATVPGLGPIASSAFAATTPDVAAFRSARDYAAWLGLTPRVHSSGGKERLGRISKAGNRYLRRLLYLGAMMSHRVAMRSRPMANDQRATGAASSTGRDCRARLAPPYARQKAGEGCGRRARSPHGPHRLGAHRPRRQLPGRAWLRTRSPPDARTGATSTAGH